MFIDESGANIKMTRSHVWVRKGKEHVESIPTNWGKNLTMIGAIRLSGWITMGTMTEAANGERFISWLKKCLLPKLRKGDIVVMDNVRAHYHPMVRKLLKRVGAKIEYLPPYSPDLNPIEPGWAITKKNIKKFAPRNHDSLRRVAHAGRRRVTPAHCKSWFIHSGYTRGLR